MDLVGELGAPNRCAALARVRRIAPLDHETFDVAVEEGAVIVAGCSKGKKVECRPRNRVAKNLQQPSPQCTQGLGMCPKT
eukprot:2438996-Pleurochrysis_carterae.AAC.5